MKKNGLFWGFFFFVSQNSPLIFGENQFCNGVREAKKMSGEKKVFSHWSILQSDKIKAPLKPANNVYFYMH